MPLVGEGCFHGYGCDWVGRLLKNRHDNTGYMKETLRERVHILHMFTGMFQLSVCNSAVLKFLTSIAIAFHQSCLFDARSGVMICNDIDLLKCFSNACRACTGNIFFTPVLVSFLRWVVQKRDYLFWILGILLHCAAMTFLQ